MKRLCLSTLLLMLLLLLAGDTFIGLQQGCTAFEAAYLPYATLTQSAQYTTMAETLSKEWEEAAGHYACFMKQEELHEVESLTVRIAAACKNNDDARVRELAEELLRALELIRESEIPSLENIF